MKKVNGASKKAEQVSYHVVSYRASKMPKQVALSNTRSLLRNRICVKTRGFVDSSAKVGTGQGPTLLAQKTGTYSGRLYMNYLPFLNRLQ